MGGGLRVHVGRKGGVEGVDFGVGREGFLDKIWGDFVKNIFRTILLVFKSVYKTTSLVLGAEKAWSYQFKPPPPLCRTKSTEN